MRLNTYSCTCIKRDALQKWKKNHSRWMHNRKSQITVSYQQIFHRQFQSAQLDNIYAKSHLKESHLTKTTTMTAGLLMTPAVHSKLWKLKVRILHYQDVSTAYKWLWYAAPLEEMHNHHQSNTVIKNKLKLTAGTTVSNYCRDENN